MDRKTEKVWKVQYKASPTTRQEYFKTKEAAELRLAELKKLGHKEACVIHPAAKRVIGCHTIPLYL